MIGGIYGNIIQALLLSWFCSWVVSEMVSWCIRYQNAQNTNYTFLVLVLYVLCAAVAVPLSSFYPFGTSYNDSTIGPTLDGGAPLYLSQSFVYFNASYDLIYVSDYIYLHSSIFTSVFAPTHACMLILYLKSMSLNSVSCRMCIYITVEMGSFCQRKSLPVVLNS